MQEFLSLAGIVSALALGAISPGPSFVMVARVAVATSRAHGLRAAAGMGAGGSVFAAAALLGLQTLLLALPSLYLILKLGGGLYLCVLGMRIIRGARTSRAPDGLTPPSAQGLARAFWLGLATQLSNPKTAIVYASVFAAFLPATVSLPFAAAVIASVFLVEAGWYAVVALLLSAAAPRGAYLRCRTWIDRSAGLIMLLLGAGLIWPAGRP